MLLVKPDAEMIARFRERGIYINENSLVGRYTVDTELVGHVQQPKDSADDNVSAV